MALYDHRVFLVDDVWWVAQVHGGSGAGAGPHPAISHERVLFTRVGAGDEASRTAQIPAGSLNEISYRSLRKLLETADAARLHIEGYPYNAPWRPEVPAEKICTDEEGLQWTIQQTSVVRGGPAGFEVSSALELSCLSDSAMKGKIVLNEGHTYDDALRSLGRGINDELIRLVKSTFRDLPDPHSNRP